MMFRKRKQTNRIVKIVMLYSLLNAKLLVNHCRIKGTKHFIPRSSAKIIQVGVVLVTPPHHAIPAWIIFVEEHVPS